MIAALYVATGGAYFDLPGVDPWDEARDARRYAGPHPVVAHPPCSTWCQLASVNEARYGHPIGDDGGCFAAALGAVRTWGGVLEHPAYSLAWARFGLTQPRRGYWQRDLFGSNDGAYSWVTEVCQSAYGHRARKRTWLYYVGDAPPPALDWRDVPGEAWVSYGDHDRYPDVPRLGKAEAKATPPAFRDLLIAIARGARRAASGGRVTCRRCGGGGVVSRYAWCSEGLDPCPECDGGRRGDRLVLVVDERTRRDSYAGDIRTQSDTCAASGGKETT